MRGKPGEKKPAPDAVAFPTPEGIERFTIDSEAHPLMTSFRRNTLSLLLELAASATGAALREAHIGVWRPVSDKAESRRLELSVKARLPFPDVMQCRLKVFEGIAEYAKNWNESEREDYRTQIIFTLEATVQ